MYYPGRSTDTRTEKLLTIALPLRPITDQEDLQPNSDVRQPTTGPGVGVVRADRRTRPAVLGVFVSPRGNTAPKAFCRSIFDPYCQVSVSLLLDFMLSYTACPHAAYKHLELLQCLRKYDIRRTVAVAVTSFQESSSDGIRYSKVTP